ncbi:hypothetical protein [Salinicoccus cyprini]|nr:hypothetical protein [Salinicoccus cyprini]
MMVVTNMVSTLFMPVRAGNPWETAGQQSSQVIVYASSSILPIVISTVVAFGLSYFFYRRFAKNTC